MLCASLILGAHLASYHADKYAYQNNANPGAYVECDGWSAGAYRNTFGKTSAYAGYTFRSGPFGLSVGGITGYQKFTAPGPCRPGYVDVHWNPCVKVYGVSDSKINLMLAPSITFGPARLWFIPKMGDSSSVLHLSVQVSMKERT